MHDYIKKTTIAKTTKIDVSYFGQVVFWIWLVRNVYWTYGITFNKLEKKCAHHIGWLDGCVHKIHFVSQTKPKDREKKQQLSTLYFMLIDFPSSRYDDKMIRNELAGVRSRVYDEPIQVSCAKRGENNDHFYFLLGVFATDTRYSLNLKEKKIGETTDWLNQNGLNCTHLKKLNLKKRVVQRSFVKMLSM